MIPTRSQHISLIFEKTSSRPGVEIEQDHAARLMERYDIFNLPVVDDDGRLVGVVWMDDMI
ncbi:MAG: CBS domain-containing protein [Chloroflexi bacterium]|nr:CBS domain-containing protein [Chloroflexota bacterium]